MLYISNEDKPGLIGDLGKLLGSNNINISNFHLGKATDKATDAIALIATDRKLDKNIVEIISNMPSVIQLKSLDFS